MADRKRFQASKITRKDTSGTSTGPFMVRIFVGDAQTEVLEKSMVYFKTVAWCYPFLGSIFLYRNALQGLGYGLVPMLGGIFELAALIPIVPYYFYRMKKYRI